MRPSSNNRVGGPAPKFNDYHIWKALMSLDDTHPLGRKRLASVLGIGEGSTRTILSILQEEGYIDITKDGILINNKGLEFREVFYMDVKPFESHELTISRYDSVAHLRYAAKRISFGCEERDAAILAGAKGATTLICVNGRLTFPGSDYPVDEETENALRAIFSIRNDDVIIIGTADSPEAAECGAVSAALNTLGGLRLNRDLRDVVSSYSSAGEILSLAFAVHELVGGLPVCAKSRNDLGVRIEDGAVIDNAYTGEILEEVIRTRYTVRRVATSGPYKGIRVIVTPIDLDGKCIAAIGVVDIRSLIHQDSVVEF